MNIGAEWRKIRVTTGGIVPGVGPGSIFGGIIVQAAGTSTTLALYDDTTAVAANLIIPATDTSKSNIAGVFVSPFGGAVGTLTSPPDVGAGLALTTGLFLTLGGTGTPSIWVLFK